MYDQYYGLTGRPFQLTPDPHFYFDSVTHRKAMSYLGYGLAQGEGFIVITGEVGAGKTTLVGHLMATVDPARLTAVKIVSTQVEGDDMLRLAAQAFGLATENVDKGPLLQRIEAWLHAEARAGRRTLLIVDEAQNLPVPALEELRMLSNFQLGSQALVQIFLLGQPEFRNMLAHSPELEQLRQRVIANHHLEPMLADEVEPYLAHRLSLVGWKGNPNFTTDATEALYSASGGIPRRLNALASRVLLLGAIDRLDNIDRSVVDAVVADMEADKPAAPETPITPRLHSAATPAAAQLPAAPLAGAPEPLATAPVNPAFGFEELHALRAEISNLRQAVAATPAPDATLDERITQAEQRIAALEARAGEQDGALRRVLTLLVEWVERDTPVASMPPSLYQDHAA